MRRLLLLAALALPAPAQATEVFAHRGGPLIDGVRWFPENTLPAFRHAARNGTALELDVRLTLDRVPLVIHDAWFDRTTTCHGSVAVYDSGVVRRRCRARWPGSGRRTVVPTLAGVLRIAARHHVRAMVEIKSVDEAWDVVTALRRSPLPQRRIIVQSFLPRALRIAQEGWPGVPTALLSTHGDRHRALKQSYRRFTYVAPRWPVSRPYVSFAHALGVRVLPFGLHSAAAVDRAAGTGADALITDDPAAAFRALVFFAVARGQRD